MAYLPYDMPNGFLNSVELPTRETDLGLRLLQASAAKVPLKQRCPSHASLVRLQKQVGEVSHELCRRQRRGRAVTSRCQEGILVGQKVRFRGLSWVLSGSA